MKFNNYDHSSQVLQENFTFTKYEVHGGSLHCAKYVVKTSEDVGFDE